MGLHRLVQYPCDRIGREQMMTKVLFVISAADRWTLNDGTVHPSGYWAEEVAVPHRIFSEAGWDIGTCQSE
jgi:hypothetical protein